MHVLVVGTGAIAAAHLPTWISWVRAVQPEVDLRIMVTKSATRFVSAEALRVLGDCEVILDQWDCVPNHYRAFHVETAEWADATLVYPATMNFLTRFSIGMTDTPALLTLQCSEKPVVIAPSLPSGAAGSPLIAQHLTTLKERKHVTVLPTVSGFSVGTGERTPGAPVPFPQAWEELGQVWQRTVAT
ncbi:flavoprotein [Streptomyces sp. NBC_00847]|uniref:flavoprotein n=1 Tax=Streptomyces sp. NBC_00847 TaxID=2975850 RepID=UPI00224DFB87|nr:flavoprotein [Streptomyces sp. NBC_00847]MCX4880360.1 flavoprotein [Streptomyces sp. NBC_00847]